MHDTQSHAIILHISQQINWESWGNGQIAIADKLDMKQKKFPGSDE